MTHEMVEIFRTHGLRLRGTLEEMLEEQPAHRTERRGCGFTQATRFLSTYINGPGAADDPLDLDMFEDWPSRDTRFAATALLAAGWEHGWRRVDELELDRRLAAPQFETLIVALADLKEGLQKISNALVFPESRLATRLLAQILARDGVAEHCLPPMPVKPLIGSCSQAEEFFLELAHGRVRRGGSINIFVDESGRPLLIEKMNLGESHSAVVLETVCLNGVELPPGSLCALAHTPEAIGEKISHGLRFSFKDIAEARFLRLTTLAVEPEERKRAFSSQFEAQLRNDLLSPGTTTLSELRQFAVRESQSAP